MTQEKAYKTHKLHTVKKGMNAPARGASSFGAGGRRPGPGQSKSRRCGRTWRNGRSPSSCGSADGAGPAIRFSDSYIKIRLALYRDTPAHQATQIPGKPGAGSRPEIRRPDTIVKGSLGKLILAGAVIGVVATGGPVRIPPASIRLATGAVVFQPVREIAYFVRELDAVSGWWDIERI